MTSPDEPAAGKHCTKCGVWKVLDEFRRQAAGRFGRKSQCTLCTTFSDKARYENNRKGRLEKAREYRSENRDRWLASKRRYRETNRKRLSSQSYIYQSRRRARWSSLPSETVLLREIALRDGAACWMCDDELSEWNPAHLDHLIPLAADADQLAAWSLENPGTVRANMALACPSCNIRKSNRLMLCALARYVRNLNAESETAA